MHSCTSWNLLIKKRFLNVCKNHFQEICCWNLWKDGFHPKRLIEICWSGLCIFPTRHHIKTSKHDGKPQKLHLNKQIKIGLWRVKYKLVLAAQTLSPFPRRSDLYGLPSSVAACRDSTILFFFVLVKHTENLDIKSNYMDYQVRWPPVEIQFFSFWRNTSKTWI